VKSAATAQIHECPLFSDDPHFKLIQILKQDGTQNINFRQKIVVEGGCRASRLGGN